MDSGNSGSLSLQSSSGGGADDEFDSRSGGGDSSPLSKLLRQPPALSSVLPAFGQFGGSFYGIHELATPSLSHAAHWSSSTTTPLPAGTTNGVSPSLPSSSSCQGVAASAAFQEAPAQAGAAPPVAAPPRGSRKRTRASRRAPTTVLTTDTSNFRAMVQEFTGIPAPPFAGGASARSRFDHLFPLRSAGCPAALSPYLLRPFAQKLQASPYPPFISTSSSPAPANKAIATSTAPSTATVASSDSYQHASAPSSVLGRQDHSSGNYLSFQSPIGAHLDGNAARYPTHVHPMFDAASPPSAQRLPDPTGFSGLAHGVMSSESTHLHPRHCDLGHGGDELSGLVGARSVSIPDSCNTTYSSDAGPASRAGPLLERNMQSTTAIAGAAATTTTPVAATTAMRAQGVESWICTSE